MRAAAYRCSFRRLRSVVDTAFAAGHHEDGDLVAPLVVSEQRSTATEFDVVGMGPDREDSHATLTLRHAIRGLDRRSGGRGFEPSLIAAPDRVTDPTGGDEHDRSGDACDHRHRDRVDGSAGQDLDHPRVTPVTRVAVDEDRVEHLAGEDRTVDNGADAAFVRRHAFAASGLLKSLFFACRLHTLQAGQPPLLIASGSLGSNFRGPQERPPPVGSSIQVALSLPVGSFDCACGRVPASNVAPPARVNAPARNACRRRTFDPARIAPLPGDRFREPRRTPLRGAREPGFRPLAGPGTRRGFRRRPRKSLP